MHKGARVVAMVALLAGAVIAGPVEAGASSAQDPTVARILIVGDSVTQGRSGDYTWRYRLWKALQEQRKSVDFVGPRTELADGALDYADPDFDQDHAARWGAMMTSHGWWVSGYPEDVTQDLVASYSPDVVIDELGVNNLLYGDTPAATIDLAKNFVADVRAQAPHATVIFGQLTQRWFTGVDEYNGLLVDMAAALDQPGARVLVALAPGDYTTADTYDTSHPNAAGEIKIADQFAGALALVPLPSVPAPVAPQPPAVTTQYAGVARLGALARRHVARLSFTTPVGATRQVIWMRDRTTGGHWRTVASVPASKHRHRVEHLRRGHRYAFRLRAYQDTSPSLAFSNVARVRVR
jgi:hypothetical protein